MLPDQADTPLKRVYFPIMLMYLDEKGQKENYADFVQRITEFMDAISNREALQACVGIIEDVNAGRYYRALLNCRKLLPFEQERLGYVD